LAMGLLKQETHIIGVIVPDLVLHFYASIISGIEKFANKKGFFTIITSSEESYKKEIEVLNNLLNARVDGIIMCLSKETKRYSHFKKLLNNNMPLVFFDRICLVSKVPCVTVDNREASLDVIKHLKTEGYKRIAFIAGPPNLNISKERLSGYLEGLKECGFTEITELIEICDLSYDSAYKAMIRLLDLPHPPDAVFCVNDTVAFAAMKAIKCRGLNIPIDVGLVGFTDDFHATIVEPSLTSVTHPTTKIGKKAASLFFEKLYNNQTTKLAVLKTKLVVRESSMKSVGKE
jgi:DNA-binding LacI/PurR family transcriptional regulator